MTSTGVVPNFSPSSAQDARRFRRWQAITLALLVTGYAGYYLCRAHFAATKPQIMAEMVKAGLSTAKDVKGVVGDIATVGTALYVVGKFLGGTTGDLLGGRRNFLLGMGGAIVFTILFALSGTLPLFTLCWACNRLLQAFGWTGLVKISGNWTHYSRYGAVLGFLSLSYLLGDWASRLFIGALLGQGLEWRTIFFVNAGILGAIFVATLLLLKESPGRIGLPELPPNPQNVYSTTAGATQGDNAGHPGLAAVILPLLRSPAFLVVCALSFASTLVRESFGDWSTTYFSERLSLSGSWAAAASSWFPLLGAAAVLIFGFLSDRLGQAGRAACIVLGFGLSGLSLVVLMGVDQPIVGVVLVSALGFVLIGPYSLLAGAIALDFGGRKGGATAAGIIDGIGYLGGLLAGSVIGRISSAYGWGTAFGTLAGVIWAATLIGAVYLVQLRRNTRRLKVTSAADQPIGAIAEPEPV